MHRLILVFVLLAPVPGHAATAIFAGGCFWCMEPPFDVLDGVSETISGYTGGRTANPTYEEVSFSDTGHREAVQVRYDPDKVSYEELLAVFWRNIDPFDDMGQFCDKGDSYRSAVFYADSEEQRLADESKAAHEAHFGRAVVTELLPASRFYPAEDYHQNYYTENPLRYKYYRFGCGRDRRLESVWGSAV
jgi:peptide-methionine (S)-S-oxide reductase